MKYLYSYSGPVMKFDTIIATKWKSETYAESEKKAKNNLSYQFKKMYNFKPNVRITLPGKVIVNYDQKAM